MKIELEKPQRNTEIDKVFLYIGEGCDTGAGCGIGDGCSVGGDCSAGNGC